MRKFITAAAMAIFATSAGAADLPAKAKRLAVPSAYPYQSSGMFFGAFTEGAAGSVAATVPGVGSASLTTTTGALGMTAGYAWGAAGSALAYSVEADAKFTNFNGNNQGLALQGPLAFEQRFVMFAPWANILALLPNFPNLFGGASIPPFPIIPAGVTASNLQMGLAFGIEERDISTSFVGVKSNKVWRIEPVIKMIAMEQLSNGTALRAWVGVGLPNKGTIFGAGGRTGATLGPEIKVGVGAYF